MTLRFLFRSLIIALVCLMAAACVSRSHIRGCELEHPYHDAQVPAELVVPSDLQRPQTKATFHVPESQHLASKPDDLVTAADVETLDKESLATKRCIMSPPKLQAAPDAPAA
jgi:uncharacterized lipoprotein